MSIYGWIVLLLFALMFVVAKHQRSAQKRQAPKPVPLSSGLEGTYIGDALPTLKKVADALGYSIRIDTESRRVDFLSPGDWEVMARFGATGECAVLETVTVTTRKECDRLIAALREAFRPIKGVGVVHRIVGA